MRSLRTHLVAMTILLVLLVGAATVLIVRQVDTHGRAQNERQLLDTARALSLAVDGQLQSYRSLLEALGTSEALAREDWPAFDRQARAVLAGPDAWIVVGDRAGQQWINTRLAPGAPLPKAPPPPIWDTLDRGETRVCNLAKGAVEARILCVDVPVMRDGRAAYHLSVIFRPMALDRVLARGVLGEGRLGAVVDRTGTIAWRSSGADRFIGSPATADLRAVIARQREGVISSESLEGVPTLAAFSRSPLSGWDFVVGVPEGEIAAPRQRAVLYGLAIAAVFLLAAAALAYAVGRRFAHAMDHLSTAARRIGASERPEFEPSGVTEIDVVGRALDTAVRQRDANQESFRLAQEVGGIGAWEWDLAKDEGVVSEAYREMHGLPAGGGAVRMAQVLAAIHPEDLAGYQARLGAALRRRDPSINEYRVVRADGSVRWLYAKGRPVPGPDGKPARALGVVLDLTERKLAEERLKLLMREVDHRANNLMAVVQGAVSLSRASDPETLRQVILGRVDALARAHQLLAASRWAGADLRRIVEEEVRAFDLGGAKRVLVEGESVPLPPAIAQSVAMAVHELATNAVKHGALSAAQGRVLVRWTVADDRVRLTWEEKNGPPVREPTRRGFGTTVIQRALGGAAGTARMSWLADGLVCTIEFPLAEAGHAPEADISPVPEAASA